MSLARQLLAFLVIGYSVTAATLLLALVGEVWIREVLPATMILDAFKGLGVNAPGALLVIGLLFTVEDDERWLSWRVAGIRRLWLGAGVLLLVGSLVTIGVALAGPGYEHRQVFGLSFSLVVVILVPQLFLMSVMALFSLGYGIAELLGFAPVGFELYRRDPIAVVERFVAALNDRDAEAAVALVPARFEADVRRIVRGQPHLVAGPSAQTEDGISVPIHGVSRGPVAANAHVEVRLVENLYYTIHVVEL
jgi:hypothetical protein